MRRVREPRRARAASHSELVHRSYPPTSRTASGALRRLEINARVGNGVGARWFFGAHELVGGWHRRDGGSESGKLRDLLGELGKPRDIGVPCECMDPDRASGLRGIAG